MGAASDPFGRQEAGKGQVEGWVAVLKSCQRQKALEDGFKAVGRVVLRVVQSCANS